MMSDQPVKEITNVNLVSMADRKNIVEPLEACHSITKLRKLTKAEQHLE